MWIIFFWNLKQFKNVFEWLFLCLKHDYISKRVLIRSRFQHSRTRINTFNIDKTLKVCIFGICEFWKKFMSIARNVAFKKLWLSKGNSRHTDTCNVHQFRQRTDGCQPGGRIHWFFRKIFRLRRANDAFLPLLTLVYPYWCLVTPTDSCLPLLTLVFP